MDIKELRQIATKEQERIDEKAKRRMAKFTMKFISKVEKDIKGRAKAGCFSLIVKIKQYMPLDEEAFVAYFRKQGFTVATKLYSYNGPVEYYWWDEISWEDK